MERIELEKNGWLKKSEIPLIQDLKFFSLNENKAPLINEHNSVVRNVVYDEILNGTAKIKLIDDPLSTTKDDVLIGEIDRYGLPLRTVINKKTGLVRSDPYYADEWLSRFYKNYYRSLYTNKNQHTYTGIFKEQIARGEYYYNILKSYLSGKEKILEVGCGMGGILFPFKMENFDVTGIDLGSEYVDIGNKFNLNLKVADISDLILEGSKFDLIILSHLIEHIVGIDNFILKLKDLLSTSGKIFIAVPGIEMIHATYNGNVHIYLQNAHCWSFSKNTLSAILNKNGFRITYIDDHINCIAEQNKGELKHIDLQNESSNILKYLKDLGKARKISYFKKISRRIKKKLK
ncbi:MAG: class I SAM-dependent methyltransferase [Bacteroidetes bacterium]|nr:class I SAM-dependent methyltransferase [Bacteroidota bacterium]